MKHLVACGAAVLLGGTAHAQADPSRPALPYGLSSLAQFSIREGYRASRTSAVTPTMKRARIARILSLKAEVDRLLKEDDGALSRPHQDYIRREYGRIMRL